MKTNFLKEEIQGLLLDFSKRQKLRDKQRQIWKEERRISRAKRTDLQNQQVSP